MTESQKNEIMARLRATGQWDEANKFRETVRVSCRAKGMGKAESVETSWTEMAKAFPAGGTESTNAHAGDMDVDALLADDDLQPTDLASDVLWAYRNLENRKATPQKAPGPGAWGLLVWGRQYRNAFYEKLLPRALAARDEEDDEKQVVKREKKSVAYLENLLQQMVDQQAEEQG